MKPEQSSTLPTPAELVAGRDQSPWAKPEAETGDQRDPGDETETESPAPDAAFQAIGAALTSCRETLDGLERMGGYVLIAVAENADGRGYKVIGDVCGDNRLGRAVLGVLDDTPELKAAFARAAVRKMMKD